MTHSHQLTALKKSSALFDLATSRGMPSRQGDNLQEVWRKIAPGLGGLLREINRIHANAAVRIANVSSKDLGPINQAVDFSLALRDSEDRILSVVETIDCPAGLGVCVLQNFFRELLIRLLRTWKPKQAFKAWPHRRIFARGAVLMARARAFRFMSAERSFASADTLPWELERVCATHLSLADLDKRLKQRVSDDVASEAEALMIAVHEVLPRRGEALYQPTFERCGILAGGAGDIFIHDTLYELKCIVSERGFDRAALQQMLAYCVLNNLSHEAFLPIGKIALLNPRRGFKWTAKADDVCKAIGAENLDSLTKRFLPVLRKELPTRALIEAINFLPPFLRKRLKPFLKILENGDAG